jgi:hypothetical protein
LLLGVAKAKKKGPASIRLGLNRLFNFSKGL